MLHHSRGHEQRVTAMKTKAAILTELNTDWKIDEIDLGDPVAGEVQVKLAASGLCHSDAHVVDGSEALAREVDPRRPATQASSPPGDPTAE